MLADQLDYVVGVDPHRDSHALAVVDVRNGAVVFEANVAANSDGYRQALVLGEEHAPGRRVFAVEGTGSFGPVSRASSRLVASGCSRSAGFGGSAARAVRPTRSTRSVPPAACSRRSGRRRLGRVVNVRRCRRWCRTGRRCRRQACRSLPAARSADHDPGTAPRGVAAAHTRAALAAARGNAAKRQT